MCYRFGEEGSAMMPDFDNDGKRSLWEGAAADLWQRDERDRIATGRVDRPGAACGDGRWIAGHGGGRRSVSGCGCGNVVFGCALILGFALVVSIALVVVLNLAA